MSIVFSPTTLFWIIGVLAVFLLVSITLNLVGHRIWHSPTPQPTSRRGAKTTLDDGEQRVIEAYSRGHMGSRHEALEIYYANIGRVDPERDVHMRFMREMDSPVPDRKVLDSARDALHRRCAARLTAR